MLECSKDAGRLVSFSHCDNITDFMDDLYEEFKIDNQNYFIGNFIYKDLERTSYRNWIQSNILDTFGYGISSMDATAPSLCTSDGTTDTIPSGPTSEYFLILKLYYNLLIDIMIYIYLLVGSLALGYQRWPW